MTSPFVQFFENVNFSSSYKGLSVRQIWFNIGEGKQSYGGGQNPPPPQVENVLNRPGEIGLSSFILQSAIVATNQIQTVG